MWHITRAPSTPERSAAAIARFSGSSPLLPTTSSVSRTLMPSSTSGFSASILAAASTPRVVDVQHLAHREARQADRGDVQEGEDAGARRGDAEMLEGREAAGAGVARAHIGRGAGEGHQLVAGQADAGARQDVGVEVDEARQDELARGVEHLRAARRRDLGLDGGDHGVADADVPPAAQVLAGIDHLAAADDEIVGIVRPEGRRAAAPGPPE